MVFPNFAIVEEVSINSIFYNSSSARCCSLLLVTADKRNNITPDTRSQPATSNGWSNGGDW